MNPDGSQLQYLPQIHNPLAFKPCGHQVVLVGVLGWSIRAAAGGGGWHADHEVVQRRPLGSNMLVKRVPRFINYVATEKIWRTPAAGGAPEFFSAVVGEGSIDRLSVSPDGKFLACLYQTASLPGWDLGVISTQGGLLVHRYRVPGGSSNPRWSPDGTSLQYLLTRHGVTNIWELSLSGGSPKQLTPFSSDMIFDVNWSTDVRDCL
jgi:WD40-like Beta Propeller Repeat